VDDPHATPAGIAAVRQEFRELVSCGRLAQAVKIQFVLNWESSRGAGAARLGCAPRRAERQRIAAADGAGRCGAGDGPSLRSIGWEQAQRHHLVKAVPAGADILTRVRGLLLARPFGSGVCASGLTSRTAARNASVS